MEIEFHNREREIEEIMRILSYRPDSIYFVYGPINSGKTELFQHLLDQLPKEFVTFYVNLRERMIKDYRDFIEALFEVRESKRKDVLKELISEVTKFVGFPISKTLLDSIFKEDRPKNAFRYIVKITEELKEKGKKPILILDELQKIGDVKVDDYLIYELFNLLVRLTKEKHCCHVFAITSDSLFIEKVFNEAMLQGRCDYLLVDDFDYNTTVNFLKKYGFSKEEIQLVWNYFGGKPVYLVKAIKNKHRLKEFCEEFLNLRVTEIKSRLKKLKELGERITIGEEEFEVEYNKVLSALKEFKDKDTIPLDALDEITTHYLIKINLLFLDPLHAIIKPQSRLDLLAIRKILENLS
jgi:AAA+ ATPase superfamily predicted ATPase